jgi:multidrug efflux pump subunit AcrB
VFPALQLSRVDVTVVYPGAGPSEVEEGVLTRLEEAVADVSAASRIRSFAYEGRGVLQVELQPGRSLPVTMAEIKARVDAINTLPVEAERPLVSVPVPNWPVINLGLSGPVDEPTLILWARKIREEIVSLPGVSMASVSPPRDPEIAIEVSEHALRRHGLTFDALVGAVRASSLDLPAGEIEGADGGRLRVDAEAASAAEFARLPLIVRADGSRLAVGAVASVTDGFTGRGFSARLDGELAASIHVFRTGTQDAIVVSDAVKDYVAAARARLPRGLQLTAWRDSGPSFASRIRLLASNGASGVVLVLVVLGLFLRLRTAFWVAVGVGVSFLGAFAVAPLVDISINMVSLFGFVVVLGLLVDDAIIVGESVRYHEERGMESHEAAVAGTLAVSRPVIMAALTTVVAFLPMIFLPGDEGPVWSAIGVIVIATLVVSLGEALFLLPSHLAENAGRRIARAPGVLQRIQSRAESGMRELADRYYRPVLDATLRRPEVTLAVFAGIAILSFGAMRAGLISVVFFPKMEGDFVMIDLEMPVGTPIEETDAVIRRMERAIFQVRDEFAAERGDEAFGHMLSLVGATLRGRQWGDHTGGIFLELAADEGRAVSGGEIVTRWRAVLGAVPEATAIRADHTFGERSDDLNLLLSAPSSEDLRVAAEALESHLRRLPGVHDVTDSESSGRHELIVTLLPKGEALGLSLGDLARQLRMGFHGAEVQRIQRGRDDVRVMVRYPESERRSVADLYRMRVRTRDGSAVPFSSIATVAFADAPSVIRRTDRRRTLNVEARIDGANATFGEVMAHLEAGFFPKLRDAHPELGIKDDGGQRDRRETNAYLRRAWGLSMAAIYAILAMTLRSYGQPLIVLLAVPFGVIGSILGHSIRGIDVSMLSLLGVVAASGVVVNDALVFMDAVNRFLAEGRSLPDAVREAGSLRLRPIVLTSITTFVGLLPIILQQSVQAQFLVPMAVSLGFDVMFATFVTLLLVPAACVATGRLWRPPAPASPRG